MNITRHVCSEIGGQFPCLNERFQKTATDWCLPIGSEANLADQLDWEELSHYVDTGSATAGDIDLSWISSGDILADRKGANSNREQYNGNSEEASERRRAQNRASQRAYRERRERHVKCLEKKLQDMVCQHELLAKEHSLLRAEHERVLENSGRWKTEVVDVKGGQSSYATGVSKVAREKEVLVRVMMCRKTCRNPGFFNDD